MNRRLRRAEKAQWRDFIEKFHADSSGVFRIFLVRREDGREWVSNAVAGGESIEGEAFLRVVSALLNDIRRGAAPLCLTCNTEFTIQELPEVLLICLPHRGDPKWVLGHSLCRRCAALDEAALWPAILKVLRQTWPDLKTVDRANLPDIAGSA